jgi:hypothetical protein
MAVLVLDPSLARSAAQEKGGANGAAALVTTPSRCDAHAADGFEMLYVEPGPVGGMRTATHSKPGREMRSSA